YYLPTSCLLNLELDYNNSRIRSLMIKAKTKYESKWLKNEENIRNFNALMKIAENTFEEVISWTTANADKTEGTIFDSTSKKGVNWSSYGPTESFSSPSRLNAPDRGIISRTFFDTTDGGSNYFYDKVLVLGDRKGFKITNVDGSVALEITTAGEMITGYTDYTVAKQSFEIIRAADEELLRKQLDKR
ncbi:MAG: hypothetical protein ACKOFA_04910, partial [Rhodoluna sp.]